MSCRARPLPTKRGRRCVPPPPGTSPSVTSGWPNFAVSTAILSVHAIAVSQPPPSAKPLTAAITGLPRFSMRSRTLWPKRLARAASKAASVASSVMSAPAMNAFSPAPVRIAPRIAASSRTSSNAVRRSFHVGVFSALSAFGRLIVTYAMQLRLSSWLGSSSCFGLREIGSALLEKRRDRFLGFSRLQSRRVLLILELGSRRHLSTQGAFHQPLARAHGPGRLSCQSVRRVHGGCHEVRLGHDARDESQLRGAACIERQRQ